MKAGHFSSEKPECLRFSLTKLNGGLCRKALVTGVKDFHGCHASFVPS